MTESVQITIKGIVIPTIEMKNSPTANSTIEICARQDVKDLLARNSYDAIISFSNSDRGKKWDLYRRDKWRKSLLEKCSNVLCFYFDDWTLDVRRISERCIKPNSFHIKQIMEFCQPITGRMLIHCQMGISRSTACGVIVLMEKGMSEQDAQTHVQSIRSIACPNDYMISLYREVKMEQEILGELANVEL